MKESNNSPVIGNSVSEFFLYCSGQTDPNLVTVPRFELLPKPCFINIFCVILEMSWYCTKFALEFRGSKATSLAFFVL